MARTGCAFAAVTCLCSPARTRCDPQVLPAYGLQDSRTKDQNSQTKSNPNTMCLPGTLGEDHGSGHFYLAKTRTFLLCVDTNLSPEQAPHEVAASRKRNFAGQTYRSRWSSAHLQTRAN